MRPLDPMRSDRSVPTACGNRVSRYRARQDWWLTAEIVSNAPKALYRRNKCSPPPNDRPPSSEKLAGKDHAMRRERRGPALEASRVGATVS